MKVLYSQRRAHAFCGLGCPKRHHEHGDSPIDNELTYKEGKAMNKRLTFLTFIIATLLADCTSTPTRINGLNLENSGLASDIELNGVLISHGDKFILDKSFQIPIVPHDKDTDRVVGENSVPFTVISAGPWEFNGSTLFPEFNSLSIFCADTARILWRKVDCDRYSQLEGPFIHIECKYFYVPKSSITYSQRLHEIEQEKAKVEREKKKTMLSTPQGKLLAVLLSLVPPVPIY